MAEYITQVWADTVTDADAAHMNHMEAGIANAVPKPPAPPDRGPVLWDAASSSWVSALLDNRSVSATAAIARSKLDFGAGLVNADVAAAAAIARSKLNFGSGLVDADIAAGAAIAHTKISVPSARMTLGTPQTIGHNVLTSIAFSATNWLNGGITFGSSALTVPVAGIYLVNVALNWASNATGSIRYTELRRQNNLAVLQEAQGDYRPPISGGFFTGVMSTIVMSALAGDTFYTQVQQDSGAGLNVNNAFMTVAKIG